MTTPAQVVDASDGAFIVQVPIAALEAPFGGRVAMIGAQINDGSPLPPWMHFDPATGLLSVDLPNTVSAALENGTNGQNGDPYEDITAGIGSDNPDELSPTAHGSVQIEVTARDANGGLAKLIFTIDLAPKLSQRSHLLPPGRTPFAVQSAVDFAIDLGDWTPLPDSPPAAAAPPADSHASAGRPGLSQQLAGCASRAMHAERIALIASAGR